MATSPVSINKAELERVMSHLLHSVRDSFGTYTAGLNSLGISGSSLLLSNRLQASASALGKTAEAASPDSKQLLGYVHQIEADLFAGLAIGVIDRSAVDRLVDELYTLIKE